MLLGAIADDFTGASDLANTLARGGMSVAQFVGVPAGGAAPGGTAAPVEAAVVALKTRSAPATEAVGRSLEALRWLQAQGCRQFLFKYCSTFDSTPEGNIGPVALALLDALGASAAIVCPAFPGAGRTLYQGHLFVADRLLSESGMEHHPLTPMTDPDIRRWLARQIGGPVGHVARGAVARGPDALRAALAIEAAAGRRLVVVDAVDDADLDCIGAAAADERLVTGGSGVARALPENFRRRGLLSGASSAFPAFAGPVAVLSGSCSAVSNAQVARYAERYPAVEVAPDGVVEGAVTAASVLAEVLPLLGRAPMVYSTARPGAVAAAQARHGRERVAAALEKLFGAVGTGLVAAGARRLVVGGGETSGAVVGALGIERMRVGPEIAPGVPALAVGDPPRLGLALKSGNFGGVDFYETAARALAEGWR